MERLSWPDKERGLGADIATPQAAICMWPELKHSGITKRLAIDGRGLTSLGMRGR